MDFMEGDMLQTEARTRELLQTMAPEVIGSRIRRERISQSLSIRDLAAKANLSPHSITRLESGASIRPITLVKVCSALAIHLDRISAPAQNEIVAIHKESDNRWHQLDGYLDGFFGGRDGVLDKDDRKAIATNTGQNPLVILNSRLEAGVLLSTIIEVYVPSVPRSHPGEEFVYALTGPVSVIVNNEEHILSTGDSMIFWGTEVHSYKPVGDVVGKLLSIRVRI